VGIIMTVPERSAGSPADSKLVRIALWVAIGALIVAAIVCVIWVLVGTDNGVVGRAFLTVLLLAAFAGVALLDARLAARRPPWFALASMVSWVLCLLFGAILIWMPAPPWSYFHGFGRFVSFLLIVLVIQLALLHARLVIKAHQRYVTGFTRAMAIAAIGLTVLLAAMLVIPLAFQDVFIYPDVYWRVVVAIAILAAVATALVPLLNALFGPKRPGTPRGAQPAAPIAQWPTYADGVTPLPVMPDGSPDWNAYYTGYPSVAPQSLSPGASPTGPVPPSSYPSAHGYDGYPPPPPLPPRP
jgi:hypothetical protein